MYIEAWSEITLLVPKCYLRKTSWSNGTLIYTLNWVPPPVANRVECTNSGDWSAYISVTCDQWNTSQIILKKKSDKIAANKIHVFHVNASVAKIRQILNTFDLDLWLQIHIGDLRLFVVIYTPQAIIVPNMNTLSQKHERGVSVTRHKTDRF